MHLSIPPVFRNKYIIAFAIVFVWVAFFDKNNLVYQYKLRNQLKELERDKAFFIEEIVRDSTASRELLENPEALERFAREKYLMKKSGEDIFIIIEE